jgi:hypothetical protein
MDVLILFGVPLAAICAAGFVLHFFSSNWVVGVSNVAIGVQVAGSLVAFVLPETMPQEAKYEGEMCPDFDSGQGDVLYAIAFGSIVVGAIALASSFIAVRRQVAHPGRLLAGIAAAMLVPAIFVRVIAAAFCGFYN